MGLRELLNFKTSKHDEDEIKCRIRDLITLAAIDGQITDKETAFIFSLLRKEGINVENYPTDISSVHDAYPSDNDKKIKHITQMTALMMIDGECAEEEIKYCKAIAAKMGLEEQTVGKLVTALATQKQILNADTCQSALLSFFANGGGRSNMEHQNNNTDIIRQKIRIGFDQIVKKTMAHIENGDTLIAGLLIKSAIINFYYQMEKEQTLTMFCNEHNINYKILLKEECDYALQKYLEE